MRQLLLYISSSALLKRPWICKSLSLYKVSCTLWELESTVGVVKTARSHHLQAPIWKIALLYSVQNYQSSSGTSNVNNSENRKILLFELQTAQAVKNYDVKFGNILMGPAFDEYPDACSSCILSWRTLVVLLHFCPHALCIIHHVYQILQNKGTKKYRKDVAI